MSGYAKVQDLRAKLKPFRKYSGHYTKLPEVKLLLQENVAACQQFMINKDTTELSTINTKVLLNWAECLYALGRKFGERKLFPVACEKYELVAKHTGPQDDYLVYCKWAIAECEQSLHPMFFKDGRGKKALYKKGEALFKKSMDIAGKSSTKRSRVLYSWSLALFRYSRSCESMCTSKEVFRMYQKAGQMFYDAYTVNPNNKDAIYKWGKLLDSQALIIAHRNDPELMLADDVELFLIVFSSLAMRGKLNNLKILTALCLSPEEVTQQMAIKVLDHLSCFLDTPSQIPPTPRAIPSPPPTPLFTPSGDAPLNPFSPSIHPVFTSKESVLFPETPKSDIEKTNPFESPSNGNPFAKGSPSHGNPFAKESPKITKNTNPFENSPNPVGTNPFETESPNLQKPPSSPQQTRKEQNNNGREGTNPFDFLLPSALVSKLNLSSAPRPSSSPRSTSPRPSSPRSLSPRSSPRSSPVQTRKSITPPPPLHSSLDPSNIAFAISPTTSPAPLNRITQLQGINKPISSVPASVSGISPRSAVPTLDLNLNDSGGVMGSQGDFLSPSVEESRANQKAIMEEAQAMLVWIKQIIVQNHTLTITTKMQALKSLGDEGQRVWRASKIPYQEALDNFEIFANCINFHTKRQLGNLQRYLTAPDDVSSSSSTSSASSSLSIVTPNNTSPPSTPSSPPSIPTFLKSSGGLMRSDSAPIVRSQWIDKENGQGSGEKRKSASPEKRSASPEKRSASPEKKDSTEKERKENNNNNNEIPFPNLRPQRSKSFGAPPQIAHDHQILIHDDIHKYYTNHNKIGRGGFGDVFTAKSKKTGKTVAIKSMRRNFEDHFKQIKREIKLMKSSVHPNMVNYIESFICHDHVWIVMEYCDGGSLRHFAKNTLLEDNHISYISKQILQGLSYLHSQRRIHRDIKADNVLLNLDASVKLADLGIAADLDDPDTPSELMNLCGSKFWMAPEMIKFKPYNSKVDIWGFGCLLIELAEGRHPYEGQHSMAAMFHTATKGADSLSDPAKWSELFRDFLAQCFQMNPSLRPSADDLLQHPFIKLYDPEEMTIRQEIIQRLDNVFVSLQLENILF